MAPDDNPLIPPERRLLRFTLVMFAGIGVSLAFPKVSFWTTLALLSYVYVGYPVLLGLAALVRRRPDDAPPYCPTVSIVIPAHNEEAVIVETVRNCLNLDYPPDRLEVVVVSDGSTDRSDELLASIDDPRFRWLRLPAQAGKTTAQNKAVGICKGEVVVFSDATTRFEPDAIKYLTRHYRDPKVGGVSGRYKYVDDGASSTYRAATTFWSYENTIKLLQSRVHTMTGCSGCLYSVRRELYTPLPARACSDLVEPLTLVRRGYRVVFERRALAYEGSTASMQEEFRMRVRVAAHGIDGILSASDLLNVFRHHWVSLQLISHKVLRWMVPVFLFNLLVTTALLRQDAAFEAFLFVQLAFYAVSFLLMWAPLRGRWKLLALPSYFCTLNAAVVVAAYELLSGKVYTTWCPVRH